MKECCIWYMMGDMNLLLSERLQTYDCSLGDEKNIFVLLPEKLY